jgi:cation diffusion facilitator family transporter
MAMENLDANFGAARESRLWRAMSWSLGIAIGMVFLKMGAYFITGSAAILSDAAEAIVHVVAVLFATYSLRLSSKPADATHRYGHAKIGFFSAGVEGSLILLVAFYIYFHSGKKLIYPEPVENLPIGMALTIVAAAISGALGLYLIRVGRKYHSLVLGANGKHTLADCWTSAAVLISLVLTWVFHWAPIDPLIGILIATNILFTGIRLVRSGFSGLMDAADPAIQQSIVELLDRETNKRGISYHNLRHRNLGDTNWVEFHLVFPAGVLLSDAHRVATEIEEILEAKIPTGAKVTTHLESALDHDIIHRRGD